MAIQYVDANADAVSSLAQNYAISAGVNDKLQIVIDGGSNQNFTLTPGGARTAAQISADINLSISGAIAYAVVSGPQGGHVRIRTLSSSGAGSTIVFNTPANNANATLGFTGTYAGASRIHNTWTQTLGTKQELINQIETQLNSCGWTTISGSGTTNLLLQGALSPPGQDLQYRLRVKDNAGNCIAVSMENVAGTVVSLNSTTAGVQFLPAVGKSWIFTFNKYGGTFHTSSFNVSREFGLFGLPALPPHLQGVITECAFIQGNSDADTDATVYSSFRTQSSQVSGPGNSAQMLNGSITQNNNVGGFRQGCQTYSPGSSSVNNFAQVSQWHDGASLLFDALIGFDAISITTPGSYKGYIWDASVISGKRLNANTATSFDSHNWVVVTEGSTLNEAFGSLGQLIMVTP